MPSTRQGTSAHASSGRFFNQSTGIEHVSADLVGVLVTIACANVAAYSVERLCGSVSWPSSFRSPPSTALDLLRSGGETRPAGSEAARLAPDTCAHLDEAGCIRRCARGLGAVVAQLVDVVVPDQVVELAGKRLRLRAALNLRIEVVSVRSGFRAATPCG